MEDHFLRKLFRDSASSDPPPLTPNCVDAETLAAWSERSLPADEASKIEAHISTCARCQSLFAMFARTEPAAPVAAPFWQRFSMGWLVPIAGVGAAAVVAFVIWTNAHSRTSSTPQVGQLAPVTPPPNATETKTEPSTRFDEPKIAAAKPQEPRHEQRKTEVSGTVRAIEPPASLPAAPPPVPQAAPAPRATPPPPPPPPPPAAVMFDAISPVVAKLPASAVVAEFQSEDRSLQERPTAVTAAPVTQTAAGSAAAARNVSGGGGRGGAARPTPPPPPPPAAESQLALGQTTPIRWRIYANGTVDKSTSDGFAWDHVTLDSLPAFITAGTAPARTVCWLVGRGGVVFVSADAIHFTRLTFPEAIDLKSITATDALHATIIAVDGRTFTTENGGISWKSS